MLRWGKGRELAKKERKKDMIRGFFPKKPWNRKKKAGGGAEKRKKRKKGFCERLGTAREKGGTV